MKWLIRCFIASITILITLSNISMAVEIESKEQMILLAELEEAKQLSVKIESKDKEILAWLWLKSPQGVEGQKEVKKDIILEGYFLKDQIFKNNKTTNWTALLYQKQAWQLVSVDKTKEALDLYELIPESDRNYWVNFHLGELYSSADSQKSNSYFEKAYYQSQPAEKNNDFVFRIANSMYLAERYDQAIILYSEIIQNNVTNEIVFLYRGNSFFMQFEYIDAINDYSKGIEKNPSFKELYLNRARSYSELSNQNSAINDYLTYLNLDSTNSLIWNEYIAYLRTEKRTIELENALQLWVVKEPNHATAWNTKGAYFFAQEQYQTALVDFQEATTINPELSSAWYNQALCYEQIGIPIEWSLEEKWERLNTISKCYENFLTHSNKKNSERKRAELRINEIKKYSGQILDI